MKTVTAVFPLQLARSDGDGRTVPLRIIPWMEVTGDVRRLRFARGSVTADQVRGASVRFMHAEPVGVVTTARDADDALHGSARLADPARNTAAADVAALLDVHAEVPDSPGFGVSVSVTVERHEYDQESDTITVLSVKAVHEVSLVDAPALAGARASLRFNHHEGDTPMGIETKPVDPPLPTLDQVKATFAELAEPQNKQMLQLREEFAALVDKIKDHDDGTPRHPLDEFSSLDDYWTKLQAGKAESFALADQITGDNPGVVSTRWANEVKGIIDWGRPTIGHSGGPQPLPPSGLEDDWAYYDGDLSALVGVQPAEKADVVSAKVSIKAGTAPIKTYAGGSDISIQLLERSSPSYREAYLRIMAIAYGQVTEAACLTAFDAAATGVAPAPGTAANFWAAIRVASLRVRKATGRPASGVAVKEAVYEQLVSAADADGRPMYGAVSPSNAPDTGVRVSEGMITVDGIPVYPAVVGTLTADGLAFNGTAARWAEEGPRWMTNDVVAKLGRDYSIYGYASPRAYFPAGLVPIDLA